MQVCLLYTFIRSPHPQLRHSNRCISRTEEIGDCSDISRRRLVDVTVGLQALSRNRAFLAMFRPGLCFRGGATIGSGWYIPPTFKSWGVQGGTSWLHRGYRLLLFVA